jgi:hypothetical protein
MRSPRVELKVEYIRTYMKYTDFFLKKDYPPLDEICKAMIWRS